MSVTVAPPRSSRYPLRSYRVFARCIARPIWEIGTLREDSAPGAAPTGAGEADTKRLAAPISAPMTFNDPVLCIGICAKGLSQGGMAIRRAMVEERHRVASGRFDLTGVGCPPVATSGAARPAHGGTPFPPFTPKALTISTDDLPGDDR